MRNLDNHLDLHTGTERDLRPTIEMNPSYPMPFDLANQIGVKTELYKIIGRTKDSPGNLVLRHPYQTISVGKVRDDQTVDVEASKKQEKALREAGWVDRIEDIKGLPKFAIDDPYAPLPSEGVKR